MGRKILFVTTDQQRLEPSAGARGQIGNRSEAGPERPGAKRREREEAKR